MPVELSELAIRPRRSGAVDDGNLVNATGAFSSSDPEKTVSIPRDFALDSDISTIIASTNTWGLLISNCETISLNDLIIVDYYDNNGISFFMRSNNCFVIAFCSCPNDPERSVSIFNISSDFE